MPAVTNSGPKHDSLQPNSAAGAPISMPLTAVIVDDEQLAREELKYLLHSTENVEVVAEGSNGIEAVDLVIEHQPDVVFLDVQMPGLDGFAVLEHLLERPEMQRLPQIVFATAYDQYAVRAFDVNAVDYLLKPFDRNRIVQALERTRARLIENGSDGSNSDARLPARRMERWLVLFRRLGSQLRRASIPCWRCCTVNTRHLRPLVH